MCGDDAPSGDAVAGGVGAPDGVAVAAGPQKCLGRLQRVRRFLRIRTVGANGIGFGGYELWDPSAMC